jgi:hypothetical protein
VSFGLSAIAKRLILKPVARSLQSLTTYSRLVAATVVGFFLKILELADAFTVSELISKAFGKSLTDSAGVTDVSTRQIGKNPSDSLDLTEDQTFDIGKVLVDAFSTSDDETLDFGKVFADSLNLSDDQSFVMTKALSDIVYATDDLDGEASLEDDQEFQFTKVRSELLFVYESEVKLIGKRPNDSASVDDSGNYRGQGYCDFTYFAEDYVGYSGSFT